MTAPYPCNDLIVQNFPPEFAVHALWNLYGNPYQNRAEKEEETVTWLGNS